MSHRVVPGAVAALALLLLGAGTAGAQSASPSTAASGSPAAAADGWQHEVALYLAAVGMSGSAAVGNVGADVDLPFSEIFDHLETGGMAAWRGVHGDWAIMVNASFFGLGATKDLRGGGTAEVDFDETLLEVDGSRRFAKSLEFYFGARYVGIDGGLELRLGNGTTLSGDDNQSWVDPLVGLRYEAALGKSWMFVGRADVGGFGVGSDLAWQAMARFDWRFSSHFGVSAGYLILDIDYDSGSGDDYFLYDIAAQGPLAAALFRF